MANQTVVGATSKVLRVGDVRIHRVEEWEGDYQMPQDCFSFYDEAIFRRHEAAMKPHFYNAATNYIYAFMQSWVLEVDGRKILYDTGVGNDKVRPGMPVFQGFKTPFLERLAAAGFAPEDIDIVICSHLHIDHVGWNTRLVGDRWVPTFPNARYVFSRIDREFYDPAGPGRRPSQMVVIGQTNVFEDSVQPLLDAGVVDLVEPGDRLGESIKFSLGPGHTPGHLVTEVVSRGETALFVADILHHPIQLYCPDWNSPHCDDQELATQTRRRVLDEAVERNALVVPTHFGGVGACRVRRVGNAYEPVFELGRVIEA